MGQGGLKMLLMFQLKQNRGVPRRGHGTKLLVTLATTGIARFGWTISDSLLLTITDYY